MLPVKCIEVIDLNVDVSTGLQEFVFYIFRMLKYLTRTMDLAVALNASVNSIEEILKFVKDLINEFNPRFVFTWPETYTTAINLMKQYGYTEPKVSNICFSDEHPMHWYKTKEDQPCPDCGQISDAKLNYSPIKDKIQRWAKSPSMCKKMLGHWEEKDVWLNKIGVTYPIKEIWHGSRFKELSWFWDPSKEWYLPIKCGNCDRFFSIDYSSDNQCPFCYNDDNLPPQKVKGDPRNIALIGHWDGFQPGFGRPKSHSCGMYLFALMNTTIHKLFHLIRNF